MHLLTLAGAGSDFEKAKGTASNMVTKLGMGPSGKHTFYSSRDWEHLSTETRFTLERETEQILEVCFT